MNEAVVRDTNRIPDLVREMRVLLGHDVTAGLHAELVLKQTMIAATVNEYGATIKKTPKMRAWLGIMARKHGVQLDKSKGQPGVIVIPARSFLRSAVAERSEEIMTVATRMLNRVIEGAATGMSALNAVGLKMEQVVKSQIKQVMGPPLHPLTVAMKGSDKPLIRTGMMWKAVRYRIAPRGGQ